MFAFNYFSNGVMNSFSRVYLFILTAVFLGGSFFFGSKATMAHGENEKWGAPVKGLQLSISKREAMSPSANDIVVGVALRNVGEQDLVLNLGYMLNNGRQQYPDAVKLILVDAKGKQSELQFIGAAGGGGSKDIFAVPLPKGATYYFQQTLNKYLCPSEPQLLSKLARGNQLRAKFVSTSTASPITNILFWTGTVESNSVAP